MLNINICFLLVLNNTDIVFDRTRCFMAKRWKALSLVQGSLRASTQAFLLLYPQKSFGRLVSPEKKRELDKEEERRRTTYRFPEVHLLCCIYGLCVYLRRNIRSFIGHLTDDGKCIETARRHTLKRPTQRAHSVAQ